MLIGFASEDDWFDYRLEHDPRFLQRVERARQSLRAGHADPHNGDPNFNRELYAITLANALQDQPDFYNLTLFSPFL